MSINRVVIIHEVPVEAGLISGLFQQHMTNITTWEKGVKIQYKDCTPNTLVVVHASNESLDLVNSTSLVFAFLGRGGNRTCPYALLGTALHRQGGCRVVVVSNEASTARNVVPRGATDVWAYDIKTLAEAVGDLLDIHSTTVTPVPNGSVTPTSPTDAMIRPQMP